MMHSEVCRVAATCFIACSVAFSAQAEVGLWQVFPFCLSRPKADLNGLAMMPKGRALAQLADREWESVTIAVDNETDELLEYTVDASAVEKAIPGMSVEVHASWTSPVGEASWQGKLMQSMGAGSHFCGETSAASDPYLPCPPDRVLRCPPWENRVVFLTLRSEGVKPGAYTAPIKVRLPSGEKVLPLTVEVWPFELPAMLESKYFFNEYTRSYEGLKDVLEHGGNVIYFGADPNDRTHRVRPDGTVAFDIRFPDLESKIVQLKKLGVFEKVMFVGEAYYFRDFASWAARNGMPYMSDRFKETFKASIRATVAHLKELGIGYDRFALYHNDEACGGLVSQVVEMGPVAREADPNVRWLLFQMSSFDQIRQMAPYTQVMSYRGEGTWSAEARDWYDNAYRKMDPRNVIWQGKPKGLTRGDVEINYYNRYRPWRTWLNHWDGTETFAHAYLVYKDDGEKPISVRQWEATREGAEDYKYFELYLKLMTKVGRRDEAVRRLDKLVQDMLGPTGPATWSVYNQDDIHAQWYPYWVRQQLAKEIVTLSGGKWTSPAPYEPPVFAYALPSTAKEVPLVSQAEVANAKTLDPVQVEFELHAGGKHETYWAAFAQDEYTFSVKDVLTPGEKYRIDFEYCCPPGKNPSPVLESMGLFPRQSFCTEKDGKFHFHKYEFTVPEGMADLNFSFKEIRNMSGEAIVDRCELRNAKVVRLSRGGKKFAPSNGPARLPPIPASRGIPGEFTFNSAAVRQGHRYAAEVEYAADFRISQGLVISTMNHVNRHGPQVLAYAGLPATGGEVRKAYLLFTADQSREVMVRVGRRGDHGKSIEFADENGVRREAKLDVRSIRLYDLNAPCVAAAEAYAARVIRDRARFAPKPGTKLDIDRPGFFSQWTETAADGSRKVVLRNERTNAVGYMLVDKSVPRFGWREIVVPAGRSVAVPVAADETVTELWAQNGRFPDVKVEWKRK